ncbi:g11800 [Coccomyxa elongata]
MVFTVSGSLAYLRNVSETLKGDIKEDIQELLHRDHSSDPCSSNSLRLPSAWSATNPYSFPKTACVVQKALGIIKEAPTAQPSPHDRLKNILHHIPQQSAVDNTDPAYAFDLVRNATSGGPFIVNPQIPPVGGVAQRKLLETGEFAKLDPLNAIKTTAAFAATPDTTVTIGSETVYTGYQGTIDATNFFNTFYNSYSNPAITKFRLQTGTYTVQNTTGNFNLFLICNAIVRSHFEVDFGGSTIRFVDGTLGAVFFANCYNMSAYNATFYYDISQNPWYQATLTDISVDGITWNITVQDGYPIDQVLPQGNPLCVAWDPDTRLPRKNSSDIYVGSTTSLGGRNFQMKFGYVVVGVFIGDFITCRTGRGNHGILPWYSQDSTFRDFTIYNSQIFGIYEETGKSNTYINNKVIPYPFPVGSGGAREAPLQSALADGFHASGSFIGPTLIGNTFLNMGDDGIAIHGRYYLVVGTDKPQGVITVATLCGYPCDRLYQGNSLLAYQNTTQRLGFTKMLSVTQLSGSPLPAGSMSVTFPNTNLDQSGYLNITIDCWPPAYDNLTFDSVVTSLDNQGNGFTLINNTVAYNRGRGTLLKANNGVITGNQFIQPKFIAAQITPEFFFVEADFSSNLLIDGNIFDSYFGGIEIAFINDHDNFNPGKFQNHANINITNNIIRNAADQPLLITSSVGVVVRNNTFDNVLCYPYTFGAALPFVPTPQPPIYLAYSSNLQFSGNSYIVAPNCTYGNFTSPIQTYQNTVTGLSIQ